MFDSSALRLDWLSSALQWDQLHVGCLIISPGSVAFASIHCGHMAAACVALKPFGVPLQHAQPCFAQQNRVTVNPPRDRKATFVSLQSSRNISELRQSPRETLLKSPSVTRCRHASWQTQPSVHSKQSADVHTSVSTVLSDATLAK